MNLVRTLAHPRTPTHAHARPTPHTPNTTHTHAHPRTTHAHARPRTPTHAHARPRTPNVAHPHQCHAHPPQRHARHTALDSVQHVETMGKKFRVFEPKFWPELIKEFKFRELRIRRCPTLTQTWLICYSELAQKKKYEEIKSHLIGSSCPTCSSQNWLVSKRRKLRFEEG
jgi:hypothetical protein